MDRIYLDNAATSWPKPESVYGAIEYAQRAIGVAYGRGHYSHADDASRIVEQTRSRVAEFVNAPNSKNISFTFSGTDSLSTALFGFIRPNDHVVTSVVEHNSVLRPLKHLESKRDITVSYVGCDEFGYVCADEILAAIQPDTRLVCLTHVSNVTGSIQSIENIKTRLLESGNEKARLLIDAAQSLGHIPVDVQALGCDILAAPGHKGLLGPLGTGILYVANTVSADVNPLRYGGTGTDGSIEIQPTNVPVKFESGNLNVPGIAGLSEGMTFLESDEGRLLHEKWLQHSQLLLSGCQNTAGIQLQGSPTMDRRVGVFSLSIDALDCREAAGILDANWSIQTRAGLHCAPMMHRALKTEQDGGTLRISVGLFNTREHIEQTIEAVSQLAEVAKS